MAKDEDTTQQIRRQGRLSPSDNLYEYCTGLAIQIPCWVLSTFFAYEDYSRYSDL